MVPRNNSTEYQLKVLDKIRDYCDNDLSDRVLLMNIFRNFRTGGGLRLSEDGYSICKNNNLYEFYKVKLPKKKQTSTLFTSLDRICRSPYFVENHTIYLTDILVATQLALSHDDFDYVFLVFQ